MNPLMQWKNRPKIHLSLTPGLMAMETAAALILLLSLVFTYLYWPDIPNWVPTHFNLLGHADGWGNKQSFLVFPIISIIVYGLLTFFETVPGIGNYPWEITEENAERQYHLIRLLLASVKFEILVIMFFCEWSVVSIGTGKATSIPAMFMPGMVGMILMTVVVYLIRGWQAR